MKITTARRIAAAMLAGSVLSVPVALGTGTAAASAPTAPLTIVVPAPTTAPETPVDEARRLYYSVLFTDGCEADFQGLYVGLVTRDAVYESDDVYTVPSQDWPGMTHMYVEPDGDSANC